MNQKGFIPIFLVVGLVIIILSSGGYYFWQKQRQERINSMFSGSDVIPAASVLPTPLMSEPVKNWVTYINSYNAIPSYQIQYPEGWFESSPGTGFQGNSCIFNSQENQIVEFSHQKPTDCGFLAEQIPSLQNDFVIKANPKPWSDQELDFYPEATQVAGIKAHKYVFTQDSERPNVKANRFAFNYKGYGFLIFIRQNDDNGHIDQVLQQMLDSFKFLD